MQNNYFVDYSTPKLVEPGMKYFINESLKQCHIFKEKYLNTIYNILLFVIFIFIVILILAYKYKGKLTPEQIEENETKKKYYILSKIKNYHDARIRSQQNLITGLPQWTNELGL